MRYIMANFIFLFLCPFITYGSITPDITAHNGENLIALTVRNETSQSINQLKILIDKESAPEWIDMPLISVKLLSSEKEHEITLPLKITGAPEGSQTKFEFILTDGKGRQWRAEVNLIVDAAVPAEYTLLPNFPNPFNPETTIRYTLANEGLTILKIYNIVGQPVRTIVNKSQNAGSYNVLWDGKDNRGQEVASGVYFYRLESGQFNKVRRMLFLK